MSYDRNAVITYSDKTVDISDILTVLCEVIYSLIDNNAINK